MQQAFRLTAGNRQNSMDSDFLIGLLLFAVFIICALWHIRENTKLEAEIKRKTDVQTAQWLVRFAWSRTLQLFVALGLTISIFFYYERQFADSKNSALILARLIQQKDKIEQEQLVALKKLEILHVQSDKRASVEAVTTAPTVQNRQAIPTDQPQKNSPYDSVDKGVGKPASNFTNEAIEALYNPEKNQSDPQSTMDDIKKRYEDILVIHLFLKKCKKIQPDDFNIISYAMSQEMAGVQAPEKLHADIMSAAQGAYNEIYAKSSCDSGGVIELNKQYNNYIKTLEENFLKH